MKSTVKISRSALIHNITTIRRHLPKQTKIMSVVKANAYGHDLEMVTRVLEEYTDSYAVYHFETALELHRYTEKPILILGGVNSPEEAQLAVFNELECAVYQPDQFALLKKASLNTGIPANIHFSTNTGLNREGLTPSLFRELFSVAIKQPRVFRVRGVYSHFANIEDTSDPSYAEMQVERFHTQFVRFAKGFGEATAVDFHLSSTAGIMAYEQHWQKSKTFRHTLVRPGIGLYGLYPSKQLELEYAAQGFTFQPVLSLVSQVRNVFKIAAGEAVSYGCTWTATRETVCATIPVGYSDGISRKFSNLGKVLINGEFCPVLGRQAMNLCVVDVSHLPQVKIGDEVVLLGSQGARRITAEYLAELFGTINYEITTNLDRSLKRVLVD